MKRINETKWAYLSKQRITKCTLTSHKIWISVCVCLCVCCRLNAWWPRRWWFHNGSNPFSVVFILAWTDMTSNWEYPFAFNGIKFMAEPRNFHEIIYDFQYNLFHSHLVVSLSLLLLLLLLYAQHTLFVYKVLEWIVIERYVCRLNLV